GDCDSGDGGFRQKDGILGNGFLSVSLNVNGSDGNLGKMLVAAGDGDGEVKKKKVGLRMRGKSATVNTTKHLWAGVVAATVSRTTVAPLERLKLEYMVLSLLLLKVYEASRKETLLTYFAPLRLRPSIFVHTICIGSNFRG
nr:hypothetical protein [Tanacetum cinerariifolium]